MGELKSNYIKTFFTTETNNISIILNGKVEAAREIKIYCTLKHDAYDHYF